MFSHENAENRKMFSPKTAENRKIWKKDLQVSSKVFWGWVRLHFRKFFWSSESCMALKFAAKIVKISGSVEKRLSLQL